MLRFMVCPVAALTLSLALLSGCQERQYRLDPTETTEWEAQDARILPASLIEFSDQAAENIVRKLSTLPLIAETPGQVTVILGDMNNKTQIVNTNDFEMMAQRLRNNLLNSSIAADKLTFVEARQRVSQLANKERIAGVTGDIADPAAYPADRTYALTGDFYRVARGPMNQYYMQFQLVSFANNQIVWSDRMDVKQQDYTDKP